MYSSFFVAILIDMYVTATEVGAFDPDKPLDLTTNIPTELVTGRWVCHPKHQSEGNKEKCTR